MKSAIFFFLGALVFVLDGCVSSNSSINSNSSSEIKYAKTLAIEELEFGTSVQIIHPEKGITYSYFLTEYDKSKTPAGYTYIKVPITSIITLSGTQIGMLSILEELRRIVGVSNKAYIYNKTILSRIKNGKVVDFGNESLISFEKVIASRANLLMYSGFDETFPHAEQLAQAGTICIPNFDWKEQHPLGKAEWIKFFGLLTGKKKEANAYFDSTEKEYFALMKKAKEQTLKPSVFCGNLTNDIWYTPAGESYYAQLIADAGGNYVYRNSKGIGSLEFSIEKILADNIHTSYWLNPGFSNLKTILKANPKMSFFDAVKNHKVYCYSPNMNLYWEMSAIQPHFVLSDLIRILHPDSSNREQLHFYQVIK
jgi:iron complex transport system substrate-binding protein